MLIYAILLVLTAALRIGAQTVFPPPPPCITSKDDFGYVNGSLSSTQTFYNCLANIPDAPMLPSYYNNRFNGPVTFATGMTLTNLISVSHCPDDCIS